MGLARAQYHWLARFLLKQTCKRKTPKSIAVSSAGMHTYGDSCESKTGNPWTCNSSGPVIKRWCFMLNKCEFLIKAGIKVEHGLLAHDWVVFITKNGFSARSTLACCRHFLKKMPKKKKPMLSLSFIKTGAPFWGPWDS